MRRPIMCALVLALAALAAACGPAHRHLKMELGENATFELTDEFRVSGPASLEYESTPTLTDSGAAKIDVK